MTDPTAEQIRAYLDATGWCHTSTGPAGTLWVLHRPSNPKVNGFQLGIPDDPDAGYPLSQVVERIAVVENRAPADVRDDILGINGPQHARMRAFAVSSMCERAVDIVRRQIDEARDDGWPGVQDVWLVDTMDEQASALVEMLKKTADAIKAAAEVDPPVPWHPLWTAAGHAAEVILRAEPSIPDDMDAIRARLDAMRVAKVTASGDSTKDGGNCGD